MRPSGRINGEGTLAMLIFQTVVSHRTAPSPAETPPTPLLAQYTYMRSPDTSMGMTEECVIFHPCALVACHRTLPLSACTAIKSAFPPGASTTFPLSSKGHWPAYHGGTVAPYCRTKSLPQRSSPETEFRQTTWHLG